MEEFTAAILETMRATWEAEVIDGLDSSGRIWWRHIDAEGWDDWKVVDPEDPNIGIIPPGPIGEIEDGDLWIQWCRTRLPDGPADERVSDWASV